MEKSVVVTITLVLSLAIVLAGCSITGRVVEEAPNLQALLACRASNASMGECRMETAMSVAAYETLIASFAEEEEELEDGEDLEGEEEEGIQLPARPSTHEIEIIDFAFDPPEKEVVIGDYVLWRNNGRRQHNIISIVPEVNEGEEPIEKTLNSPDLIAGNVFRYRFTELGDFYYECTLHPGMEGVISVVMPEEEEEPGDEEPEEPEEEEEEQERGELSDLPVPCTPAGLVACEQQANPVMCKIEQTLTYGEDEMGCFDANLLDDITCGDVFKDYFEIAGQAARTDRAFIPGLLDAFAEERVDPSPCFQLLGMEVPVALLDGEGLSCSAHAECNENLSCLSEVCQRETCSETDVANDPTKPGIATLDRTITSDLQRPDRCRGKTRVRQTTCTQEGTFDTETIDCPRGTTCQSIENVGVCVPYHEVRIVGEDDTERFEPNQVTIKQNEVVRWINDVEVGHSATADEESEVQFDTRLIAPTEEFDQLFSAIGEHGYHCSVHPSVEGSVVVEESEAEQEAGVLLGQPVQLGDSEVDEPTYYNISFSPRLHEDVDEVVFVLETHQIKDKNDEHYRDDYYVDYFLLLDERNVVQRAERLNEYVNVENQNTPIRIAVPREELSREMTLVIISGAMPDRTKPSGFDYDEFRIDSIIAEGTNFVDIEIDSGNDPMIQQGFVRLASQEEQELSVEGCNEQFVALLRRYQEGHEVGVDFREFLTRCRDHLHDDFEIDRCDPLFVAGFNQCQRTMSNECLINYVSGLDHGGCYHGLFEGCWETEECVAGKVCSDRGKCVAGAIAMGGICQEDAQCSQERQPLVCRRQIDQGRYYGDVKKCMAKVGERQPCEGEDHCAAGLACENGTCVRAAVERIEAGAEGSACNIAADCNDGLRCLFGICQTRVCSETDEANNPLVPGTVTLEFSVAEQVIKLDQCLSVNSIKEWACSGDGGFRGLNKACPENTRCTSNANGIAVCAGLDNRRAMFGEACQETNDCVIGLTCVEGECIFVEEEEEDEEGGDEGGAVPAGPGESVDGEGTRTLIGEPLGMGDNPDTKPTYLEIFFEPNISGEEVGFVLDTYHVYAKTQSRYPGSYVDYFMLYDPENSVVFVDRLNEYVTRKHADVTFTIPVAREVFEGGRYKLVIVAGKRGSNHDDFRIDSIHLDGAIASRVFARSNNIADRRDGFYRHAQGFEERAG